MGSIGGPSVMSREPGQDSRALGVQPSQNSGPGPAESERLEGEGEPG